MDEEKPEIPDSFDATKDEMPKKKETLTKQRLEMAKMYVKVMEKAMKKVAKGDMGIHQYMEKEAARLAEMAGSKHISDEKRREIGVKLQTLWHFRATREEL